MLNIQSPTGKKTVKVSKWTYEHVYKDKGYKIVSGYQKHNKECVDDVEREHKTKRTESSGYDYDVESIPIAEMNKAQLLEYAKHHNIDVSSAKSNAEARKIIREAVNKDRM